MKAIRIFFLFFILTGSLYAQENTVLWDFGLKTGMKWNNGKTASINNPLFNEIPLDIYPHFHNPSLSLLFTFYPKAINLGFETNFEYHQFSGIIQSKNQGAFDMSDYQRDIISFKENVKYLFVFGRSNIEYVFQPFAGIGIGLIPSRGDFNVSSTPLTDANGIESLGTSFETGIRPMHNTSYTIKRCVVTTSLGVDVEIRMSNFSIGARVGYDIGLNNFYTQKLNYKYIGQDTKSVTLKYYDSGVNIGISLKYLFRN